MKKIILVAACLFVTSTVVNAQETTKKPATEKSRHEKLTPEQRAQKHVDGLHADVTLTDDQKTKVHDLAVAKIKKVDEIRAKYAGQADSDAAIKREMEPVKKDFRKNVKALLTPEQLEKFKAKHAGKETALDHD